jgi:hypothetical protein
MGRSSPSNELIPHHTKVDASNRITLPKHFSDRITWMKSDEVKGWLFLIGEGRYRLLSDEQCLTDPELEPIRQLIVEGNSGSAAASAKPPKSAIIARLMPVTISPPGPGWRISIPKALEAFLPDNCNKEKFSVLFSVDGHWEVWHTDMLRKAALLSIE